MAKPKPKPSKKAAAVKRPSRAPKKTKPRMREATHAKPTKKARPAMTAAATEPRGAGSGETAVATRNRQYNESPKEYAKGDIAKGRLDPDNPDAYIAHRDRRAFLEDQAAKNEAANDELNAIQVEQNNRAAEAFRELDPVLDPDKQRADSMETAVAALKMHDPDERKKAIEANQKNAKAAAKSSPNTPDFKQGQASG